MAKNRHGRLVEALQDALGKQGLGARETQPVQPGQPPRIDQLGEIVPPLADIAGGSGAGRGVERLKAAAGTGVTGTSHLFWCYVVRRRLVREECYHLAQGYAL